MRAIQQEAEKEAKTPFEDISRDENEGVVKKT